MIGPDKTGEERVREAVGKRIKDLEVELKHWRKELKKFEQTIKAWGRKGGEKLKEEREIIADMRGAERNRPAP